MTYLRYADDTTLMSESGEELKSSLMKVKEESEKTGAFPDLPNSQSNLDALYNTYYTIPILIPSYCIICWLISLPHQTLSSLSLAVFSVVLALYLGMWEGFQKLLSLVYKVKTVRCSQSMNC